MKIKRENDFISVFDEQTGMYIRSGIMKEGKDTELVDDVLMKVIEKIEVPSEKEKRGRRSHEER